MPEEIPKHAMDRTPRNAVKKTTRWSRIRAFSQSQNWTEREMRSRGGNYYFEMSLNKSKHKHHCLLHSGIPVFYEGKIPKYHMKVLLIFLWAPLELLRGLLVYPGPPVTTL